MRMDLSVCLIGMSLVPVIFGWFRRNITYNLHFTPELPLPVPSATYHGSHEAFG